MKKTFFIVLLASTFLFAGCTSGKAEKKLRIKESIWSGFSQEQSPDKETTVDVISNQNIELTNHFGDNKFHVTKVDGSYIDLSIENLGVEQGSKINEPGVDLNDCGKHQVRVKAGETIELYTCTMDAGANWEVTYL